jgi:hypothetical protein
MNDQKTIQDLDYDQADHVCYSLILSLAEQVAYKITMHDDEFYAKAKVLIFEL